jgi:hypothetical protein
MILTQVKLKNFLHDLKQALKVPLLGIDKLPKPSLLLVVRGGHGAEGSWLV